jgi:thiosulfate/3-mercaptopyruvate sulfurtransferase
MNPLIRPDQLIAEPGDVVVIDVRHDLTDPTYGFRAYAEGHLPNAAFLSVDEDLSGEASPLNGGRHPLPDQQAFAKRLEALGVNENTLVVGYDSSGGNFAARLWWLTRWVGHLRVAVLDGGISAWLRAGGGLQTNDFKPARKGHLSLRPTLCPRWDLPMVAQWVKTGANPEIGCLLDARPIERYAGETEPFDPVAGHIPGALNRPNALNLEAGGCFKPPSVLREEFLQLLGDRDPMSVVHSCGSGINACHNLLAMETAGLVGSALYAGSWSEWCADPARPVATGRP